MSCVLPSLVPPKICKSKRACGIVPSPAPTVSGSSNKETLVRIKVATFGSDRFIFSAVFFALAIACPIQSLHAQGLDRIERERAISMLNIIKKDLTNNYYDPKFRGMDVEARRAFWTSIRQDAAQGRTVLLLGMYVTVAVV